MCWRNAPLVHRMLNSLAQRTSQVNYSRWSHRKPSKVLLPFERAPVSSLKEETIISLDLKEHKQDRIQTTKKSRDPQLKITNKNHCIDNVMSKKEKLKKRKFYVSQNKVFDDNNEIIYEKLQQTDSRISNLLVKLKSKKERQKMNQVLVEGWRLIVDGLQAQCSLSNIIFSRHNELERVKPHLPQTGVMIYKIPYKEIDMWSDVETSSGIFGVFNIPNPKQIKSCSKSLPLQIICDNVRDPGNLGAILRAAVGAGCEKVLLVKGCVDLWDAKVLRSAAGAHFRMSIYASIDWEEVLSHTENTSVLIADSRATVLNEDRKGDIYEENVQTIPVLPYYGVDYTSFSKITLIIGGETEGISNDSYSLAASCNGLRINIPLQSGVDSLNTGMATAVIAFEIRKQLIQHLARENIKRQAINTI